MNKREGQKLYELLLQLYRSVDYDDRDLLEHLKETLNYVAERISHR